MKYFGTMSDPNDLVTKEYVDNNNYAICPTIGSNANKAINISNFSLTTGINIRVKFTNADTSGTPTLNVSNTGAVAIKSYGTSEPINGAWKDNEIVSLVYDGTYWMIQGVTNAIIDDTLTIQGVAADAKATGDGLKNIVLKPESVYPENISFVSMENNLVDPDNPLYVTGYLTADGKISNSTNWKTSGFVKLVEGVTYYFGGTVEGGAQCARFALTYDNELVPQRYLSYPRSIVPEPGEKYVRISGNANNPLIISIKANLPKEFTAVIPEKYIEQKLVDKTIGKMQVPMPDGFAWNDCPLKNSIYQDYRGNVFVDFDVSKYKNAETSVCYVATDGNDTNDGSIENPLATLSAAMAKNTDTIYIRGGFYNRDAGRATVTHNVNIVAYKSEQPLLTSHANATFVKYDDVSTYSAARSNFYCAYDLRYKDKYGYPLRYTQRDTIAEVQANPGSFAFLNNTIYIRCIGGSNPNNLESANYLILQSDYTPITVNANVNVYLEGLILFGGGRALYAEKPATEGEMNIYARNCKFFGSSNTSRDTVQIVGASLVYMQNCDAIHSKKDGFNYHAGNSVAPKAIEVNCKGRFNGTDINAANQGSTIHDNGKIIRVGGFYTNNHGSNIADEGVSQAWIIGCVAIESEARYESQKMGYYSYGECDLWLDSCTAITNAYCIGGGGNIFVRNPRFNGAVAPEGVTYTEY